MNPYVILCLDDDPAIVNRLQLDLASFASHFDIVCVDNLSDASNKLASIARQDQHVAIVICDYDFDGYQGVDFLINIDNHQASKSARTVLLNDKPDVDVILQAVNEGRLNYCLTKPWQAEDLQRVVSKELTTFVLKYCTTDLLRYCAVLEQRTLLDAHIERKLSQYRSGFIEAESGADDETLAQRVISRLYEFFNENDENNACRTYSADHVLTYEGQPNNFLWFVVNGEVALIKRDEDGMQHEVARLGKGSLIGGMSFVTGEVSFSTGTTITQTQVIKLNRTLFGSVMQSHSDLLPLFTSFLLRHFNRRLKGSISTEVKLQQTLKSLEEAHQQLLEKEKMAMLGQLVAGVAHELNNPVSAILRNSDTLKSTLSALTSAPLEPSLQPIANQILADAMVSRPLSTSEARTRAKRLEPSIGDRQLARKAVNMGLDNQKSLEQLLIPRGDKLSSVIRQWDMYYQAGSLLRSTNVCAQRIADMVKSLKTYARQDDESIHEVDIHEGIEDTLVMFENQLKRHQLTKDYGELPHMQCRPIALQQVWTNLVSNALDALPQQGELTVSSRLITWRGQQAAEIRITDSGSGISKEIVEKIFELNYTTKREGHFGLGIGLSVCRQIVQQHGGEIRVESEQDSYTTMIVTLPVRPTVSTEQEAL